MEDKQTKPAPPNAAAVGNLFMPAPKPGVQGFQFGVASPPQPPPATPLDSGVDGSVEFPSRPGVSYRYQLTAKNDTLSIWLEDRKTKRQRKTENLALADFVKDDLVIPKATFQDYVNCFLNCLQASPGSEDCKHDVIPLGSGGETMELRLTLKLRVFITVLTPTYVFFLKEVPLEPTDVLAAKIRDQDEQIDQLQSLVDKMSIAFKTTTPKPLMYFRAMPTQQFGQDQTLLWKDDGPSSGGPFVFQIHTSGAIRFGVAGVFMIQLMVCNKNTNNSTAVELQVNGTVVLACQDSDANAHTHVSSLCHILETKVKDEMVVVYRGYNNVSPSGTYLIIHELR